MRRVIWLCVLVAAIWCAWWALAMFGMLRGIDTWFADRQQENWQAEMSDTSFSGFPFQLAAQLNGIQIADPKAGLAIAMDTLSLNARAIWPGDVTVTLPQTPIKISNPNTSWQLLFDTAIADLNLHPGPSLELENMSLTSGPFRLETQDAARLAGAAALDLSLRQADRPESYRVFLDARDFAPSDALRDTLILPADWPKLFETLTADAAILFDQPIDRRTLEARRPQPMRIDLKVAEAAWGDVRLFASADIQRDAGGKADGKLTLKAENWQKMLDMAVAAGLIPSDLRNQAEGLLGGLAGATGSTNDLDVTLTFGGGLTRIGFLPIGPAPSMVVR